jgi:hypothetical protein
MRHFEGNKLARFELDGGRLNEPQIELPHIVRQIFDRLNLCRHLVDTHREPAPTSAKRVSWLMRRWPGALRYIEPVSDARTLPADYSSILPKNGALSAG